MVTICHRVMGVRSPMIKPISKIQNTLSQYFSSSELLSLVFKFVDKNQQKAPVFQWFTSFACRQTPTVSASNSRTWQNRPRENCGANVTFYSLQPIISSVYHQLSTSTHPTSIPHLPPRRQCKKTNTQPPYGQFVFASTLFPCFSSKVKAVLRS